MKKKQKIHKDKKGFEYIKEHYFVGGKMKYRKVYVMDGIPAEQFYERNATDLDHFKNEEYWLINGKEGSNDDSDKLNDLKPDLSDDETEVLPF